MKPTLPDNFEALHYHFIGIGGIGMSGLARLLLSRGASVSGSDRSDSRMLHALRDEGASVVVGHAAENLALPRPQAAAEDSGSSGGQDPGTNLVSHAVNRAVGHRVENAVDNLVQPVFPDVVVYSKAVPADNPELSAAREQGIPTLHRAELLGQLLASRQAVCVCGTHGKTTTTAMLTTILVQTGKDPVVMLGGEYGPLGGNVRDGDGTMFVAEACEAYGSFLSIYPDLAVVTNIEPDHLDEGATFDDIRQSFATFLGRVPEDGVVIACASSPEALELLPGLHCRVETYGLEQQEPGLTGSQALDWMAIRREDGSYQVLQQSNVVAVMRLQVPGQHNALNALGALAAAHALGVSPGESASALEEFVGVDRRFSERGISNQVMVVDDYAHHPTEISATLAAAHERLSRWAGPDQSPPGGARESGAGGSGRIIAVFQPHLYSRTAQMLEEFANSFGEADSVVITEIYAAREAPLPGVTGSALAERVRALWPEKEVLFVPTLAEIPAAVAGLARPGDMVLTMGAGDITTTAPAILDALGQ